VTGSRAARIAFARAIETHLGVTVDLSALRSDGKTDQRIMQEIIDQHQLPRDRIDWRALIAAFHEHLADAVPQSPGRLCPGIRSFLDVTSMRPDFALALGTGNFERGARLKLGAHDLNRYFATGGFGDDDVRREVIIRRGIERAAAHHEARFDRIVLVGDTPFDVEAALANGVHALGVATGRYGVDALRGAGAALAVQDLSRTAEVLRAIEALPVGRPRP
jgi:phosphoglycolate phosphatase-like HAD superfamily hydrolase